MCMSPACALPWQLRLRHHETTCLTGRSSFHWCVCVGTKHWIPLRGLHSSVPGNSVSRRLSNVWLWMSSSCVYNNIIAVEFTTSLTYSYGLSLPQVLFLGIIIESLQWCISTLQWLLDCMHYACLQQLQMYVSVDDSPLLHYIIIGLNHKL